MNLQRHSGCKAALAEVRVNANHGNLDQIGCRSLEGRIDGGALRKAALVRVLAVDVGNRADSSEERSYLHVAARFFERLIQEPSDACVFFEVVADKLLCLAGRDAELLRESEGRQTVDNAEVHDLGLAPMIGRDHERRDTEYLGSCQGMDIVAAAECIHQQAIAGKVRQQTKFDLRVVGGKQNVSWFGSEGGANAAAEFGANRNILKIRIRR